MVRDLFFRHALLPTGWAKNVRLSIRDGMISGVEEDARPHDEAGAIALPGMPNLHSHSFQRALAGLTEHRGEGRENFWTWRDLMYHFALRMNPDDIEAVATQAFVEMLEGGFSAVAEFHYLHHAPDGKPYDDIAEMASRLGAAAAAAGIDLTLLPVFYAHAGFGGTPPATAQRRFINDIGSYARLHERCQQIANTGVAPHSLRAVTPEELHALVTIAGAAPLHIHIAEQTAEVEDCVAWSGLRPVDWLMRHVPVAANWCLVHATHVTPAECTGMAASGAVVGLCPVTEANLGDGIFPIRDFSGKYGIGSDSNVLIGVAEELRMLEYSQRLGLRQRNVMATAAARSTATAMFQGAVTGGAQALGAIGGLAVGAPANIVALAGDDPDIALAQFVFATRAPVVKDVWVRGRHCVRDGRHELAESSRKRFDAVVRKLLA
ncbi:formimidoylglutamate deiminase [Acidocella aquatica]|nr:formimidoylglutamate deiminase [Acidocella aquatica]